MRTRAAAGLLVVAVATGVIGHAVGAHAVVVPRATPPPPVLAVPIAPDLAAPPAHGTHILWLFVQGRWRAVPS